MRVHATTRLSCVLLIANLLAGPLADAQQSSDSSSTISKSTPSAASGSSNGPLGDYVPCIFSDDDEFPMRAQPTAPKPQKKMDAAEAEALFDKADAVIQTELAKSNLTPLFAQNFQLSYSKLTPDSLKNMTPDQAIAKIKNVITHAANDAKFALSNAKAAGNFVRVPTEQEAADARRKASNSLEQKVSDAIASLQKQNLEHKKATTSDDLVKTGRDAISNASDLNLTDDYRNDVLTHYDRYAEAAKLRYPKLEPLDIYHIVTDATLKASEYPYKAASAEQANLDIAELTSRISSVAEEAATPLPLSSFSLPQTSAARLRF